MNTRRMWWIGIEKQGKSIPDRSGQAEPKDFFSATFDLFNSILPDLRLGFEEGRTRLLCYKKGDADIPTTQRMMSGPG